MGLSRSMILGALYCKGPLTMAEIADELNVTRKNITTLVDGLEADGLVKRTPHPTDRRATVIQPTMHGKEIGCTMQTEFITTIGSIYDCLSSPERDQLKVLLDKLLVSLEERQP